jgi:hypothetical protein
MKEINERQYLMNLGDEAMIVLNRYPSGSDLTYVSPNNERTTLKVVHHDYIIGGRRGMLARRFFLLTEEEVQRMVLPRII